MRVLCPACKKPLAFRKVSENPENSEGWEIWCGYGPCESQAANEGAFGDDLADARGNLLDKINLEAINKERAEFGLKI